MRHIFMEQDGVQLEKDSRKLLGKQSVRVVESFLGDILLSEIRSHLSQYQILLPHLDSDGLDQFA